MARSSKLNVRPVLAEFQILVFACILIHPPMTSLMKHKSATNMQMTLNHISTIHLERHTFTHTQSPDRRNVPKHGI